MKSIKIVKIMGLTFLEITLPFDYGHMEIYLRGWQWEYRDMGNVLTIAVPGLVFRWRKY